LLFKTAETRSVAAAARRAHVGRGTYYYWLNRYETTGEAGLAQPRSCAPHQPRLAPISAAVCAEVLAYYDAHPHERGCRMIAERLRQAHDGQAVIGHSKVAELIRLAHAPVPRSAIPAVALNAAAPGVAAVHAPEAKQTANIDLCVVPLTHNSAQAWAAVSVSQAAAGASPEVVAPPDAAPTWPGQVFADPSCPYAEQMASYQAQRAAKGQRKHRRRQRQAARQALNRRSDELRVARRQQRQARQQEDAAWRQQQARQQQTRAERRAARAAWRQQTATWAATQQVHRQQVAQRSAQDASWRQARQAIRSQLAALTGTPLVMAWLAILVVIDNGTRRCLQLPLFVTGVHVTAEEIVAQLRQHLPQEIQFVISDNGPQFIADAFAQLARDMEFLHVRIAPQHPQTNGIAERFVRTLKEWLAWHTWQSLEELTALLAEFIVYYNDRPHQGAELAGLSPNEFARCLECSTG
jgi:transposase InsO family protein